MATQQEIQTFCPDDMTDRFAHERQAKLWIAKGRAVFLLLKSTEFDREVLAGYGWTGSRSSENVPQGKTTFAIRIGEADQGKGLAKPFARVILAGSARLYGARDIWLDTWGSNDSALKTYNGLGFEEVGREPSHRKGPDGKIVPDSRLYMLLPNSELPLEVPAMTYS